MGQLHAMGPHYSVSPVAENRGQCAWWSLLAFCYMGPDKLHSLSSGHCAYEQLCAHAHARATKMCSCDSCRCARSLCVQTRKFGFAFADKLHVLNDAFDRFEPENPFLAWRYLLPFRFGTSRSICPFYSCPLFYSWGLLSCEWKSSLCSFPEVKGKLSLASSLFRT